MVAIDMNTIPSQHEVTEFLGREFFPKYPLPLTLAEAVDMVQIEFGVSDEDRKRLMPNGHGSDGTVLECFTHFAIVRLLEKGFLVRTGKETYKWKEGAKWFDKVPRKDFSHLMQRLIFATMRGETVESMIKDFRKNNWDENTIQAVVHHFNLTASKSVVR